MEATTIVVPSSSGSSVDSNTGPVVLSSDADSGGGNTNRKKRMAASSVVSNHGPVVLPSDDEDDDIVLDETTRKKRVAPERKRQRMDPIYKIWGFSDERTILMELAAARRESGRVPSPTELFRTLKAKGVLNRENVTREEISSKFYNLKKKFISDLDKGGPGNKSKDQKIYDLSMEVWTPEELRKEGKLI